MASPVCASAPPTPACKSKYVIVSSNAANIKTIGINDFNNVCTYNLKCIEVSVSNFQIAVAGTGNSDLFSETGIAGPFGFRIYGKLEISLNLSANW